MAAFNLKIHFMEPWILKSLKRSTDVSIYRSRYRGADQMVARVGLLTVGTGVARSVKSTRFFFLLS